MHLSHLDTTVQLKPPTLEGKAQPLGGQLRVQRDRLALPVLVLLQIKAVIAPPAPSGHPLGAAAAALVGGAAPLKHLSVKEQKQHLAGGR
ncbi:hypothetical protein SRHO_G00296050 [Serrasalmus rhombeus]